MSKNPIKLIGYKDPLGLLKDDRVMKIFNFGIVEDLVGRSRCACSLGFACKAAGKHPKPDLSPVFVVEDHMLQRKGINVSIEISDGFFVLDVDDLEKWKFWLASHSLDEQKELNALLDSCAKVKTGRGVHYYIKLMFGTVVNRREWGKFDCGAEVKSAGDIVTIPPSKHKFGRLYDWEEGEGEDPWGSTVTHLPKILARHIKLEDATKFFQRKQQLATHNTSAYHLITDEDWQHIKNHLVYTNKPTISPDVSYETWGQIAFILHSTGRDDAYDVFIEWSKKGSKYKGIQTEKIARGFFSKPFITGIHYVHLQKFGILFSSVDISDLLQSKKKGRNSQ
jgi:hypothetical protein